MGRMEACTLSIEQVMEDRVGMVVICVFWMVSSDRALKLDEKKLLRRFALSFALLAVLLFPLRSVRM